MCTPMRSKREKQEFKFQIEHEIDYLWGERRFTRLYGGRDAINDQLILLEEIHKKEIGYFYYSPFLGNQRSIYFPKYQLSAVGA